MSFAAPIFLWYFMPAVLLLYWVLPRQARNALLSVASLAFYMWGAGPYVFLLLSCIAVNYVAGLAVDSVRLAERPGRRKAVLVGAVAFDVGVLGVWKYAGFASRQVDALSHALGLGGTAIVSLALPIGISFYTFHHLSYVVDVYRRSRPAQRSVVQFVTYIAMFPQLIAGPIVRYHEISDQLADVWRPRLADFSLGFPRFALGLSKKVLVGDTVGPLADAAFATSSGDLTTGTAWLGVLAYTIQIYADFSGYTDMAIGLGQMFGFRLPENFHRPYSATSITDFWRRWHMSLSRWFRDYVYIPLGGNRSGEATTYRNLLVVFVLTGFWHGAEWTFLVWGLFHGALLVVERLTGYGASSPTDLAGLVARRVVTLLLVAIGWVFFRAESLGAALTYLRTMVVPTSGPVPDAILAVRTDQRMLVLACATLLFLLPADLVLGRLIERVDHRPATLLRGAVLFVSAPYAALVVAAGTFSPFLYFQF